MESKFILVGRLTPQPSLLVNILKTNHITPVTCSCNPKTIKLISKHYPDVVLFYPAGEKEEKGVLALAKHIKEVPRLNPIPLFHLCSNAQSAFHQALARYGVFCIDATLAPDRIWRIVGEQRAALKRAHAELKVGSIALDPVNQVLWADHGMKTSRRFAPQEFKLVYLLASNMGQDVSEKEVCSALAVKHGKTVKTIASRAKGKLPKPLNRSLHIVFSSKNGWRMDLN